MVERFFRWIGYRNGLSTAPLFDAGSIPIAGIKPGFVTGSRALRRIRRTISADNAADILRIRGMMPTISA
jgi:hypothetical protein